MIGLPTETDADVDGLVDLAHEILAIGRRAARGRRAEVTLSASSFVPKPVTPFQWLGMDRTRKPPPQAGADRRARPAGGAIQASRVRRRASSKGCSRAAIGGSAASIERAWRAGARFDGWGENFDLGVWQGGVPRGGDRSGDDTPTATGRPTARLPWDVVDSRVNKKWLALELERALAEGTLVDLRADRLPRCAPFAKECVKGVVAATTGRPLDPALPILATPAAAGPGAPSRGADAPPRCPRTTALAARADDRGLPRHRYRVRFAKSGRLRFLGHLDLARTLLRALRRARIPLVYSQGFNPKPRVRSVRPCRWGSSRRGSTSTSRPLRRSTRTRAREAVNAALPDGDPGPRASGDRPRRSRAGRGDPGGPLPGGRGPDVETHEAVAGFLSRGSVVVRREKKGKVSTFDLAREVLEVEPAADGRVDSHPRTRRRGCQREAGRGPARDLRRRGRRHETDAGGSAGGARRTSGRPDARGGGKSPWHSNCCLAGRPDDSGPRSARTAPSWSSASRTSAPRCGLGPDRQGARLEGRAGDPIGVPRRGPGSRRVPPRRRPGPAWGDPGGRRGVTTSRPRSPGEADGDDGRIGAVVRRARVAPTRCGAPIEQRVTAGRDIVVQVAREAIGTKGARVTGLRDAPRALSRLHSALALPWRVPADRRSRRARAPAGDSRGASERRRRVHRADGGAGTREGGLRGRRRDAHPDLARDPGSRRDDAGPRHAARRRVSPAAHAAGRAARRSRSDRVRRRGDLRAGPRLGSLRSTRCSPSRLSLHPRAGRLFEAEGVDAELDRALRPRVWLKSGGTIVIEPTEALVSIDVNTGKFVGSRRPEETVLKTNLEAAEEIARQLRLRDLGGIIVIDFIDMDQAESRRQVLAALESALQRDRARTNVVGLSELGLVQLTRKRTRAGFAAHVSRLCPTCHGHGRVKSPETLAGEALAEVRRLSEVFADGCAHRARAPGRGARVAVGAARRRSVDRRGRRDSAARRGRPRRAARQLRRRGDLKCPKWREASAGAPPRQSLAAPSRRPLGPPPLVVTRCREGGNGRRGAVGAGGDHRDESAGGEGSVPRERILGMHLDLDLHRRAEGRVEPSAQDENLPHPHRGAEIDRVEGGGHDPGAGVAHRHDRRALVDEREDAASEDVAARVGVLGKDDLGHLADRLCGGALGAHRVLSSKRKGGPDGPPLPEVSDGSKATSRSRRVRPAWLRRPWRSLRPSPSSRNPSPRHLRRSRHQRTAWPRRPPPAPSFFATMAPPFAQPPFDGVGHSRRRR